MEVEQYPLFAENRAALRETSKDTSGSGDPQYMTDEATQVVNFDLVKRCYCNTLGLSEECAASADALMEWEDHVAFVEFKNGNVNNRNIKDKIRDSLLLFCDITETTIAYSRDNLDFIVVYNEERNPLPNQVKKGQTQPSHSRTAIGEYVAAKAGEELILFDLERYQRLYFHKVHTYTQERFNACLREPRR